MKSNKFNRLAKRTCYRRHYQLHFILLVTCYALNPSVSAAEDPYNTVRKIVFSDPYAQLPYYRVERRLFGPASDNRNNALRAAARRTLTTEQDLVDFPAGQKLFQPNRDLL
jgi:hypothetical protein